LESRAYVYDPILYFNTPGLTWDMLPKRTQAMLVLWWLKQKNDEEEETLWERDGSFENAESTEQRLLNFYNTYVKLRTHSA